MADITTELTTISNAQYGRDVRQAIHDGLQKVNNDIIDSGDINLTLVNNATFDTGGYLKIRKVGKVIYLNAYGINIASYGSNNRVTFAQIPSDHSDLYPSNYIVFPIAGPYIPNQNFAYITTNGELRFMNSANTAVTSISFIATYFVD